MKRLAFFLIFMSCFWTAAIAQYKKDGTPDMRYNSNKQIYVNPYQTYQTPSNNHGTNLDTRYQQGYTKSNGTYVEPHYKTNNNSTNWDNFSTSGNYNPYNSSNGSRAKDYSNEAYNYGQGHQIQTGPKGGQYYINNSGNKVYVPKRNGY